MVREAKERANSYMKRSSPGIFGMIQMYVGDSPGSVDPLEYEKGTRGKLQRICSHVEECGIVGSTTPHQLRGKFHVRGHSAFSIL